MIARNVGFHEKLTLVVSILVCHFNFGVPGIPFAGLMLIVKSKLEKSEIPDFAMIFRAPCW